MNWTVTMPFKQSGFTLFIVTKVSSHRQLLLTFSLILFPWVLLFWNSSLDFCTEVFLVLHHVLFLSISWLLLNTSNIFPSGSCGNISFSVLNPEFWFWYSAAKLDETLALQRGRLRLLLLMTPLTLASHSCTVVLTDTDEVVMGRGPDKSPGVVLVFETTELVWVYFVILLCVGSPSSSKSFSLSPSLSLP